MSAKMAAVCAVVPASSAVLVADTVVIAPDGGIELQHGPFAPGRALTLRAEMNVIVVLANCPHRLDPRPEYCVTPLRASAWRGPVAGPDDVVRNAGPEAQRAFLNVDEYFRR